MTTPPDKAWVYYITHVDNLQGIVDDGCLWSDAAMRKQKAQHRSIGYEHIKDRRLALPVKCHEGTKVGDYVPFYFCPRSAMLYVINQRNVDLGYVGGQGPIIHLVASLDEVVAWANENGALWAFSSSTAASPLADFFCDLGQLGEIDWDAVNAWYWREQLSAKQAEFLLQSRAPFDLVRGIGTYDKGVKAQVETILASSGHRPTVKVKSRWYY